MRRRIDRHSMVEAASYRKCLHHAQDNRPDNVRSVSRRHPAHRLIGTDGLTAPVTHHRGEVRRDRVDRVTPRVASLPGDLLRHELMLSRRPVSDAYLAEIVDEIFLPLVEK